MVEPLHCTSESNDTIKQDMSSPDIVLGEGFRVSKTKIDVRLSGEVEDCVDFKPPQALHYIRLTCYIAVKELEIRTAFEHPRIMSRAAVVQLVE
jgi:hypothetical protein